MSLALIDRWCGLSAAARWACWIAVLLATLFAGLASYSVPPAAKPESRPEWRQLLTLRSQLAPVALPGAESFSPLNMQAAGAQLVSWQPDARGGELKLESGWASIPGLFPLLARSDTAIFAFSIAPQSEKLGISLQLEIADDR
ncbi:hypothetical protein [uncultured Pluralibacter sp.]|uniref:HofO family protein n=1 Tax=uncultured Pluralibacter sp. TaxID=1490864 RepID=UPI00260FE0F4|nr:hypothetical protein [uncultured Pluralibacter sp.]